jgi:hypothetical protein
MPRAWTLVAIVLLIALQARLYAAGPGDNQSSSAVSQPSPEAGPIRQPLRVSRKELRIVYSAIIRGESPIRVLAVDIDETPVP